MKSTADRVQAHRERRRDAGQTKVELWAYPEDVFRLHRLALRLRAMREAGIDSIDSAVPLYSVENWRAFWREVDSTQGAFRFNSS